MVQSAKHIVILTGAGISAESGIKTFRACDGLWEEHRVEDVATPEGYARDPAWCRAFTTPAATSCSNPTSTQSGPLCAGPARAPAAGLRHPGDPEHRQPARERRQQEPHSHARGAAQGALPGLGPGDRVARRSAAGGAVHLLPVSPTAAPARGLVRRDAARAGPHLQRAGPVRSVHLHRHLGRRLSGGRFRARGGIERGPHHRTQSRAERSGQPV